MNETATRDVQSVAKSLDANGIRDLPGKANRSILLADGWVTPERIEAAMARARVNPLRKSPNPTGLAVAELLRHRPEVDQWIEQHSALSSDQETPADRIVAAPHPATLIRQRIAACTQQLEHATWDESDKLRAEIKQLYKDLSGALEDGAA